MEIIPVIDLLDGRVVHARRGERQHYQPIQSSLCNSSDPLDVLQALLELYPFDQLYIADLNAIQKRGNHLRIITTLKNNHPQLKVWLDAGISHTDELGTWKELDLNWVIGSESLRDMADYLSLANDHNCVLSLDFTVQGYQGPIALLQEPAHWPDKVIAMTLSQVGSNLGPDEYRLGELIKHKNAHRIYAAGGVRDLADIQHLTKMGVSGVLIASALHTGKLTANDIACVVSGTT